MTTAAFDGICLAADRQRNAPNGKTAVSKIRLNVGKYAAFTAAGQEWAIEEVADWLSKGAKPSKRPTFDGDDAVHCLMVGKDGNAYAITGKRPTIWPILDKYAAIGSGGDYALGAMAAGKNSIEAVEIASMFCRNTGLGVDTWTPKRKK